MKMLGIKKKIITGCDAQGTNESPYLTRWTLLSCRFGKIYLHRFHRSDSPDHHDHPFAFASLILWRGYFEETEAQSVISSVHDTYATGHPVRHFAYVLPHPRKRVWPGMILFRKATHRHRVVLVNGREAWTLVFRGPDVREWGFFTRKGWQHQAEYMAENGCKKAEAFIKVVGE
jgi:hypothetical protein